MAIICFSLPVTVTATQINTLATTAIRSKPSSWLAQQVNQHPEIVAAKETMNAAFSRAEGRKKALYNPELATDYAREGIYNNFSVGINQTIDWSNKRSIRTQQANVSLIVAQQRFNYLVQAKIAQALQALITWQAAKEQADIALSQEKQLDSLLNLVTEREKAGDLGQVDVELTFLSLSQRLNNTAQAQVQLKRTTAKVKELLPDWTPDKHILPAQGLTIANDQSSAVIKKQWLEQHPLIMEAKAQWQMSKDEAQLALLATKADPTIGVSVGQVDNDNAFGLTFSMPLNIRNNFSAEARAANQQAIAAESNFRAIFRKQKFSIQASTDTLAAYKKHYQRWQQLMQGRGERSKDLLQKQWQSGDMSTTEYLLALQQRADGLNAGIELKSQFYLSQVDWLLKIGQVNLVLDQLSTKK